MISGLFKAIGTLASESVNLVNTTANIGGCAVNLLNQEIKGITEAFEQTNSPFGSIKPKVKESQYVLHNGQFVIFTDNDDVFVTEEKDKSKVLMSLNSPKGVIDVIDMIEQTLQNNIPTNITVGNVTLWSNVQATQQETLDMLKFLYMIQKDLVK